MGDIATAVCVSCGSVKLRLIGELPYSTRFAGRQADMVMGGGQLFECRSCGIQFRYPAPDKSVLDQAYSQGDTYNWTSLSSSRNDWKLAGDMVARLAGRGRILDIGCFDGGFLRTLDGSYEKYGIEVHPGAAETAIAAGINIISNDLDGLNDIDTLFDITVAIDVIEHVRNPYKFLADMASRTRHEGLIVISTGNTNALSWRIMGGAYWYCANPEHISFINPKWCHSSATSLGLRVEELHLFSYRDGSIVRKLSDTFKNLLFKALPVAFAFLRRKGVGKRDAGKNGIAAFYPPTWLTAKDHFVVAFRKTDGL